MTQDLLYARQWNQTSKRIDGLGIYKWIIDIAGITPDSNVWELGCGPGRVLLRACEVSNPDDSLILGNDLNGRLLGIARKLMEKKGYNVNLQYKPKSSIPIEFDNTSTNLEKGKVNLVGDNYQLSDFMYVKGHKFDIVLLLFPGTSHAISSFEEVKRLLRKISKHIKKGGTFLYVDRQCITKEELLNNARPPRILECVEGFKPAAYGFEENIEKYASTFYPGKNTSKFEKLVEFLTEYASNDGYSMGLYFLESRKV